MKRPRLKSNRGKTGAIVNSFTKQNHKFHLLGEVRKRQKGKHDKILVLQRIEFDDDNRIELRLAYYIIGKLRGMQGKWVWGQYASLMPPEDFLALYHKAKKKGWFKN